MKSGIVAKMMKAWEAKATKRAANATGFTLMAVSLAACNDDADVIEPDETPDEQTPDVQAPVASSLQLTLTTDALSGTAGADEFVANLGQNALGAVSNTLSSADSIEGGAGADSLDAQLIAELAGGGVNSLLDVQPTISSVETIRIQARDLASEGGAVITLDAKNITGVVNIGSNKSDGDLVIENMNTLTDGGDIRLTSDLTITMAYTDSFNSDGDASDLVVLFDEDYLNATVDNTGSTLTLQVVNAVTNVVNGNPIFGTAAFTIEVGGTTVTVDVSAIAADATLTFATAYDAVAEAIDAAMVAAGFDTVTAEVQPLEPAVFSINLTANGTSYATGASAGSYNPILITNTGAEELSGGSFTQAQTQETTNISAGMVSTPASEIDVPISINIDLEKVGRDGEGGDLLIGAKDQNINGDTDVDQSDGIEVFNINVIGDADKPSNLGVIASTDEALRTVNIATDSEEDGSDGYAALTVRGNAATSASDPDADFAIITGNGDANPFGGTLERLDADEFLGDLAIGQEHHAFDIETFTATGGGDVTLVEVLGSINSTVSNNADGAGAGLTSTGNLARSVTTGAGDDDIDLDINGGAQVTVNTGAGDDTIVASIDGNTTSESTESHLDLTSASGDNTVVLSTVVAGGDVINTADVDLGSGADTVTGGSVELTVDTGAGNDVIYADNTGTKASLTVLASDMVTSLGGSTISGMNNVELLYGQTMTITLAMPEADGNADSFFNGYEITNAAVTTEGYISTAAELNQSIADAINNDDVINKLVEASVSSTGALSVTYLVDGAFISPEVALTVEFTGTALNAASLTADQSAFLEAVRVDQSNSGLTDANIVTAINSAATTVSEVFDVNGTDSAADGGDNVVNGGAGDDVIVLSSDVGAGATVGIVDTLVMDAGDFGNDVIVHFNVVTTGGSSVSQDMLSFEFLDNMTSASGSVVSQVRIDGTVATSTTITENSVLVLDVSDFAATSLEGLTEATVLAEINGDLGTTFDGTLAATTVGTVGKMILMIEDDGNTATGATDNEGFYNVYEVTYTDASGTFTVTDVNLAGTLDFGEALDLLVLSSGNIV